MKNFLIKEFLYNGHLQSLGSVGIVLFIYFLLRGDLVFPWALAISTYCLFQPIYYFDRYKDFKKDSATNAERSKHIKKYFKVIPFAIIFLICLYLISTIVYGSLVALIYGIVVIIAGLLYPIQAKKLTRIIPLFKNLYVGSVHAILIFYPLIFSSNLEISSRLLWVSFTYILLEAFISQIILDTKDTLSDAKDKLKTLSVLIGNEKTFLVSVALSIGTFLMAFLLIASSVPLIMIWVNLIINLVAIYYAIKKSKVGYLLIAGKFSIWIILLLLL